MKMKLLILSCLALTPFIQAAPEPVSKFDAKYINENSTTWPFKRDGKIFNIDPAAMRFDFVKNAVYDGKNVNKVVGRSWNNVHWSKDTLFTVIEEVKDFDGIKGPEMVSFKVANAKEAKKMTEGMDFAASTAAVILSGKFMEDPRMGKDQIYGKFTPDGPRSGTIQINSKPVKVTMTKRRSKITTEKRTTAKEMNEGFWSARVTGAENNNQFMAKFIELTALPDPRAGDDPKLPRLLVIGDSISMNYEPLAKEALKGVVNYHRNEGNCYSSNYGTQYADYWLGNHTQKGFQWDVIHFNHGLHDLKQSAPDAPYATSLETYKANLRTEIKILKKTGATLVFCTTTPVHQSNAGKYGRQKGSEVAFNKAAMEVMKEYPEIQINDLCKVVKESAVFDECRKGWDVHYYKAEEQKVLAQAVAKAVKKALESKK
jgi:hypothetical protein